MTDPDKKYFENWFNDLLLASTMIPHGCFMRDVLRGKKRELWDEYIRLCKGGGAILQTLSGKEYPVD